jgi:hypothetical protein
VLDPEHAAVLIEALELGATVSEAAGISKVTERALESAWREGVADADAGRDTDAAAFYLESKAAAARFRIGLRARAVSDAESGRRSAADFLRALEHSQREEEAVEPQTERRIVLVPIHTPEAREAAARLLALVSESGPATEEPVEIT